MEFAYDPTKSQRNQKKHGVDFVAAQELWSDERSKVLLARSEDESRLMRIGAIRGRIWSAIYTLREERIRLISVRRARKDEEEYYSRGT